MCHMCHLCHLCHLCHMCHMCHQCHLCHECLNVWMFECLNVCVCIRMSWILECYRCLNTLQVFYIMDVLVIWENYSQVIVTKCNNQITNQPTSKYKARSNWPEQLYIFPPVYILHRGSVHLHRIEAGQGHQGRWPVVYIYVEKIFPNTSSNELLNSRWV